jgi:hypothetical protein
MKKIVLLSTALIVCIVFLFGGSPPVLAFNQDLGTSFTGQARQFTQIQLEPVVQEMLSEVNLETALSDLRRLSGIDPICTIHGCATITGRETGSDGLQWAQDYVYEALTIMGYSVEIQDWSREGYADQNLIVRKPGLQFPNQAIYFIAHLDGYLPNNPAADDDASGVVSLLELARILRNHVNNYTVVLLFTSGEEQGALGARSYLDNLTQEQLETIDYAIAVEMLGYDSNNDGDIQLWSGDQAPAFVELLSGIINDYQTGLIPQIITGCA